MKLIIRLLSFFKIVKWRFLIGLLLITVSTIASQSVTLMIKHIIDDILTPMSQGQSIQTKQLVQLSSLATGVVIVSSLVGYCAQRILMDSANRVSQYLRNQTYSVIQKLPIAYFDNQPAGKIATSIVNDTETLRRSFYGTFVTAIIFDALTIIVIYCIVFSFNVWLGSILLLLLPVLVLWQQVFAKSTKKATETFYEARSLTNTHIHETMNGIEILQLYHQEERMSNEFDTITKNAYNAQKQLIIADSGLSWNLMTFLSNTITIIVLAIIGHQLLGDSASMSIGIIFSSLQYTTKLFDAAGAIVRLLPGIQHTLATGKRVLTLLDESIESDCDKQLVVTNGDVTFNNVTFSYTNGHDVLKNISMTVKKGEVVALVGHTGSGKSSIINLLFRFYDPQSGTITIDGHTIQDYNRESVRKDMGIVLQDPYLFTGTIASNVSMHNDTITRQAIEKALVDVGAQFMLEKYEKGIDEPVVEKGQTFSSGERQLISFARTLANDPKILILDEATSHIDTETEAIIQNAMKVVQKGRTTFIIAHRLSTIQHADQILVLHDGEIVERGTHQQLLRLNGRYAEMYEMQAKSI